MTTEAKDKTDNASDNELIAEFMEYPYLAVKAGFERGGSYCHAGEEFKSKAACLAYCNDVNDGEDPEQCFFPKPKPTYFADFTLKYDTSWDWLMPVVEKIETKLDRPYSVQCERNLYVEDSILFQCNICDAGSYVWIDSHGPNKITVLYDAILEFIKFYNANQPKP